MQSMAIKHGTRRCDSKRYAKRVLFKADFAVFWAQKEVVGRTTWVFIMCISVSLPMPLSKDLIGTCKCQKKAFSGHF